MQGPLSHFQQKSYHILSKCVFSIFHKKILIFLRWLAQISGIKDVPASGTGS